MHLLKVFISRLMDESRRCWGSAQQAFHFCLSHKKAKVFTLYSIYYLREEWARSLVHRSILVSKWVICQLTVFLHLRCIFTQGEKNPLNIPYLRLLWPPLRISKMPPKNTLVSYFLIALLIFFLVLSLWTNVFMWKLLQSRRPSQGVVNHYNTKSRWHSPLHGLTIPSNPWRK